ncbi:MAG: hypothetical protein DRI61_15810 [Chloroflexi bacterium]|nr:MAG: hypothetical protein DRI61_15810 [Chloroflexota bacterium]
MEEAADGRAENATDGKTGACECPPSDVYGGGTQHKSAEWRLNFIAVGAEWGGVSEGGRSPSKWRQGRCVPSAGMCESYGTITVGR